MPRSRVPDMLRAIERIAAKHDVRIGTFGHAGDGNLHPDLVLERGDPNGAAITKAVQDDLYQAALDLGGTVTGEHGIGSARVGWLEAQRGADAVRVMRAIKAALDPQGLLNPGRGGSRALTARTPRPAWPHSPMHILRERTDSFAAMHVCGITRRGRVNAGAAVMPPRCIGRKTFVRRRILCITAGGTDRAGGAAAAMLAWGPSSGSTARPYLWP